MKMIPLVNISAATAGATVTIDLPLGVTYHQVQLLRGGTTFTAAQMKNIKVMADTKTFQEFADAAELAKYNAFYARAQNGNYNTIWFDRPELSEDYRDITAVGTLDLKKLQIQFDIDAGAVAPTIKAQAVTSLGEPIGLITKIKRQVYPISGTGEQDLTRIPQIGKIIALHFSKVADDVTKLIVKRDSVDMLESGAADLEELMKQYGRVPQALWASIDFCVKGGLSDALEVLEYAPTSPGGAPQPVQDLRAKLTLTTGGDVIMLSEHLDSLSGA